MRSSRHHSSTLGAASLATSRRHSLETCGSKVPSEVSWCPSPERVGGGTVLGRLGLEEIIQEALHEVLGEALVAR